MSTSYGAEQEPYTRTGEWSQPWFGSTVKRLRVERGLSQRDLAGDGMSTGYLSRLERGERHPTRHAATYLADRLGIPPQSLAGPESQDMLSPSRGSRELARLLALAASADSAADAPAAAEIARYLKTGEHGSPETEWLALWQVADYHGERGQYAEELGQLEQLRTLSGRLGDLRLSARAHTRLARCQLVLGNTTAALTSAEQACLLARELPADSAGTELVTALTTLISAESETGRVSQAAAHSRELLALSEHAPALLQVRARWNIAMAYTRSGDYEQACQVIEAALSSIDSRDDPVLWLRLRIAAVSLYLQVDPPLLTPAAELLQDARQSLPFTGSPRHVQETLLLEARLAIIQGDHERANELATRLESQDLLLGYLDLSRLTVIRGQVMIAEGRRSEGVNLLEAKALEAQQHGNIDLAASIWRTLAQALAQEPTSAPGETSSVT